MTSDKPGIGFRADENNGTVQFFITKNGKPINPGASVKVELIGTIVAVIFDEAVKASKGKIVLSEDLKGVPCVEGLGLTLSVDRRSRTTHLVLHAGMARMGIRLENEKCVEFGRVLMTLGGTQGHA